MLLPEFCFQHQEDFEDLPHGWQNKPFCRATKNFGVCIVTASYFVNKVVNFRSKTSQWKLVPYYETARPKTVWQQYVVDLKIAHCSEGGIMSVNK